MRILQNKFLAAVMTVMFMVVLGFTQVTPVLATENSNFSISSGATLVAQTPTPDGPADTTDTTEADSIDDFEPETTCENSFPGLGWLLCQITRGIYSVFNWLATDIIADGLLRIDIVDQEEALRAAWNGFRIVANIVFVIAFLLIIYAEAIGNFGMLEAYSLKRILPRLVVSVIGIQISFFLVGYTINFFNDLGEGAAALVLAPVEGWSQFELAGLFSNATRGEEFFGIPISATGDVVDNIIAGVAATAGVAAGAAGLVTAAVAFLPFLLLFGLTALLLVMVTLIARKIIIIGLVVLAPLAFAAYALPSTEGTFKLWWDTFWKTLAMYPIIMVFIASGQLLGRLAVSGTETNFIDSVIGFIATFLPLFIIPFTFKFAGSAIGAVVSGVTKANDAIKGDPRNQNSFRNQLKARGNRNANRLWNGEMKYKRPGFDNGRLRMKTSSRAMMPMWARAVYGRTPGTSSSGQSITDIKNARDMVEEYAKTKGDPFVRAMAVTGGGAKRGVSVLTSDGNRMNSGVLQFGKHLAFDSRGNVRTDSNGVALMANDEGGIKTDIDGNAIRAKDGDFYDYEMMQSVRRYSTAFGTIQAAAEYTMGKTASKLDENQIWAGLDASDYSAGEKQQAFNGTWARNKGDKLHLKFGKPGDYFHDGSYESASGQNADMSYDFDKLSNFVYKKQRAYDVMQQGGEFWEVSTAGIKGFKKNGVKSADPSKMSAKEVQDTVNENRRIVGEERYGNLVGMARKAQSIINSSRSYRSSQEQDGAENVQLMGSQATAYAADEAEKFLQEFHKRFGALPKTSSIEKDIVG